MKNNGNDVIVMDEGWNAEIRKAVKKSMSNAAKVKAGQKVSDPKKKKAAIEDAIKQAGEVFEREAAKAKKGKK